MIWQLFITFFSIGLVSFGGGYAMIPMIQDNLVNKGYMTLQQVADMVAISQMTPGPFAVNAATFSGMQTAGVLGSAAATIGVVTPSVVLSILVSRYFTKYREHPMVQSVLGGIRPVVVGLILAATLSIAVPTFYNQPSPLSLPFLAGSLDVASILLAAFAFLLIQKTRISPIITILICGVLGIIVFAVL